MRCQKRWRGSRIRPEFHFGQPWRQLENCDAENRIFLNTNAETKFPIMFEEPPIGVSLDALFILLAISAVLFGVTYWWRKRGERQFRGQFADLHDATDLRMNPQRLDAVYRVVEEMENDICVVLIWDAGRPVHSGEEYTFAVTDLVPFDRSRFLSGI